MDPKKKKALLITSCSLAVVGAALTARSEAEDFSYQSLGTAGQVRTSLIADCGCGECPVTPPPGRGDCGCPSCPGPKNTEAKCGSKAGEGSCGGKPQKNMQGPGGNKPVSMSANNMNQMQDKSEQMQQDKSQQKQDKSEQMQQDKSQQMQEHKEAKSAGEGACGEGTCGS